MTNRVSFLVYAGQTKFAPVKPKKKEYKVSDLRTFSQNSSFRIPFYCVLSSGLWNGFMNPLTTATKATRMAFRSRLRSAACWATHPSTVSGNKVDARASHFKYFVRSGLGAPYLSMPRRQSMLLDFEFARLVPFVAVNVVGFFLANLQSTYRIRKVKFVQKCPKKHCLRL